MVVCPAVAVAYADVERVVRAFLLLLLVLHLSGDLDLCNRAVRALLDVLGGLLSASARSGMAVLIGGLLGTVACDVRVIVTSVGLRARVRILALALLVSGHRVACHVGAMLLLGSAFLLLEVSRGIVVACSVGLH